ncbi:MAG: hypothetical protein EBT48_05865 [Verrucomicrobia bacterium]|nr:hypothetical protein [Verrucomicrobiota bacterium]
MKKLLPIFLFSLAVSFLHSAEPWARALTPWSWSFPRDHGAHPEFKTEWWYLTGNLDDENGNPYGYELTFHGCPLSPLSFFRKTQPRRTRRGGNFPKRYAGPDRRLVPPA